MNKFALAAIVIGGSSFGGALAASRYFKCDSISDIADSGTISYLGDFSSDVDLGRIVSTVQLKTALSKAAADLGYNIDFNEVYQKGYKLGSVQETKEYLWTKANVFTHSGSKLNGLEFTIHDNSEHGDEKVALTIYPFGDVSDENVKKYLGKLSDYLSNE